MRSEGKEHLESFLTQHGVSVQALSMSKMKQSNKKSIFYCNIEASDCKLSLWLYKDANDAWQIQPLVAHPGSQESIAPGTIGDKEFAELLEKERADFIKFQRVQEKLNRSNTGQKNEEHTQIRSMRKGM